MSKRKGEAPQKLVKEQKQHKNDTNCIFLCCFSMKIGADPSSKCGLMGSGSPDTWGIFVELHKFGLFLQFFVFRSHKW